MSDEHETPLAAVRFLARADSRARTVEHLLEAGPTSQRELRTHLDASRTTVSRALQALEDRGWVARTEDGYRLTHAGRLVGRAFAGTLETAAAVDELAAFLRWYPAEVELPPLVEADDRAVTYSTDAAPYAPAREQTEILRTADRLRVLLPATDRDSTATLAEQVADRGLTVESVVPPHVAATLTSETFAPLVRETIETGRSTVYVTERPVPFYLGLADDGRVQVGLADDDGLPRALLETADDGVRAWAEALYADYREGARRKPVEEF